MIATHRSTIPKSTTSRSHTWENAVIPSILISTLLFYGLLLLWGYIDIYYISPPDPKFGRDGSYRLAKLIALAITGLHLVGLIGFYVSRVFIKPNLFESLWFNAWGCIRHGIYAAIAHVALIACQFYSLFEFFGLYVFVLIAVTAFLIGHIIFWLQKQKTNKPRHATTSSRSV